VEQTARPLSKPINSDRRLSFRELLLHVIIQDTTTASLCMRSDTDVWVLRHIWISPLICLVNVDLEGNKQL
jgi:hypothetical protein